MSWKRRVLCPVTAYFRSNKLAQIQGHPGPWQPWFHFLTKNFERCRGHDLGTWLGAFFTQNNKNNSKARLMWDVDVTYLGTNIHTYPIHIAPALSSRWWCSQAIHSLLQLLLGFRSWGSWSGGAGPRVYFLPKNPWKYDPICTNIFNWGWNHQTILEQWCLLATCYYSTN